MTVDVYDRTSIAYDGRWGNYYLLDELNGFLSHVKDGSRILDAGCGHGRDLVFFGRKGFIPTGIDLSDAMLQTCRKKISISAVSAYLLAADMRILPFTSGSFSGVWCCGSFVHIPPDQHLATLRGFRVVLRREGVLWISIRNLYFPLEHRKVQLFGRGLPYRRQKYGGYIDSKGRYIVCVDRGYLQRLLRTAKFKVIRINEDNEWLNAMSIAK